MPKTEKKTEDKQGEPMVDLDDSGPAVDVELPQPKSSEVKTNDKGEKEIEVEEKKTLADSLGGGIGLHNKYTFNFVQKYVDDFIVIDEDKIAEGIKYNFEKHKIVSEGAAALSIIVVKDKLSKYLGNNIVCLICGGNIETELFYSLIK